MSLYGCNEQYWCYYDEQRGVTNCYPSAQSITGMTIISLENTLDSGGVITKFCVNTDGVDWGEYGWTGLDFYVNLKVFRKVGNTLVFVGESGPKHVLSSSCYHSSGGGYGYYSCCWLPGSFCEGTITFDCFIPGVKRGDIVGLAGVPYYPGQWGYVYVTEENNPNNLRHNGNVTTDTPMSDWMQHHSGRWSISVDIGIPEGVSGWLTFPDDAKTPLFNAKMTMTLYHVNDAGNFDYYYQYPPVYTNKLGWFLLNVASNPFSFWSWEYWKFLLWGWNRVNIKVEMCNSQLLCKSGIEFKNGYAQVELSYPLRITHRLKVKDSYSGALLPGVYGVYIDGYNKDSIKLTDANGIVEWKDAHPLIITNIVSSDIYIGQTLSIDRRFINSLYDCWQETEVLLNILPLGKEIHFDKRRYHPEETMVITFDTNSILNCKIKLYDAHGFQIREWSLGAQTTIPPPVIYVIPATVIYGMFVATLFDPGNVMLATTHTFVGTIGTVNHDLSKLCTDKLITLGFGDIDPVFKAGTPPNNMKLELFDGKKALLALTLVQTVKGSVIYNIKGTEDISRQWQLKLTDQWGNMADIENFSVFGCKQKILGRVRRLNGNPVTACNETIDLGFMGFGLLKTTTDSSGRFLFEKIPPFPETDMKSYKGGYKKDLTPVSLNEDELKMVDVYIEGLIKGIITDEENKPVTKAYIILEGGGPLADVVEVSRDDGQYDIPVRATGDQTIRVMKNNFNVLEGAVNVSEISETAVQQIKDRQLTRRAMELFDANFKRTNVAFETSLVQLDQIDIPGISAGIMVLTNSSQKIALIETTAGPGGSDGTGPGIGDGTGDTVCEYYGDDENGRAIIHCTYADRLTLPSGPTVITKEQPPTVDMTLIWSFPYPGKHVKLGQVIALPSKIKTISGISIWNKTPGAAGVFNGHAFINVYLMNSKDPNAAGRVLVASGISMNYPPYPPNLRTFEYSRTDFADIIKNNYTHALIELYYVTYGDSANMWDIAFQGVYKYNFGEVDDQLWFRDDSTGNKYLKFTEEVPPVAGQCFIFKLYGQES